MNSPELRTTDERALEICRYCEGGAAMNPADCPECDGAVMVRYTTDAVLPRIPPKHLKDGCYARADALEAHLNAAKAEVERLTRYSLIVESYLDRETLKEVWKRWRTDGHPKVIAPETEREAGPLGWTVELFVEAGLETCRQQIATKVGEDREGWAKDEWYWIELLRLMRAKS